MTTHRIAAAFLLLMILVGCSGKAASDKTDSAKSGSVPAKTESEGPSDVKAEPIALKDFPMPDGVKVTITAPETRTIMMRGPNKMAEYQTFYESHLGGNGWKKNKKESENVDGVGFLKMEKGKLTIEITFNPSRDGKAVTIIAQGSGVSVPPEKEDEKSADGQ